jgi:hypothetical protein
VGRHGDATADPIFDELNDAAGVVT